MSKYEDQVIEIIKDGPYIAYNIKMMISSNGEEMDTSPRMVLCRCGHSDDKPFCDGSHMDVDFNDEKKEDRVPDKVIKYEGKNITIYDNRGVCTHIGYCTNLLPKVFDKTRFKWIDPNAADVKDIIRICELCPSGALSYSLSGGERVKKVGNQRKKIRVSPGPYGENGPYDIEGGIELKSEQGFEPECDEHYSLCRCGASKNKPFCDGSHRYQDKFAKKKNE
jgi:CDGSH-type Zn-finger protein